MRVPLGSSGLNQYDINSAIQVLKSGDLTMGRNVADFESGMAAYLNKKYFVMVNSGSSANLAIVEALMRPSSTNPILQSGDGIIVPAIAWPTTVWPLIQLGLHPIFVDIDESNLGISLDAIESLLKESRALENRTPIRGMFLIHPLGFGLDQVRINKIIEEYSLILIDDVCESLGSWQGNMHSGTSGLASSFSFYFSHHLTTMEGGGIATDSVAIYNDLKSIRSHGWSRDRTDLFRWDDQISSFLQKFNFVTTGYNIRPMEIQGAIGISQLSRLDDFLLKRRQNVRYLHERFTKANVRNLAIIGSDLIGESTSDTVSKRHSWMHIPIRVLGPDGKLNRQKIINFLESKGVETRPPLTGNFLNQPALLNLRGKYSSLHFPESAERLSKEVFLVGCHHDLQESQLSHLADCLITASQMVSA